MILSIVTATLNARRFLPECINSVKANIGPGVEIEHIIVDGGSTDGTVEMAEARGLRVLKGRDSGIFDAINKGSFAASGDLLGFLGADDLLLSGAATVIVRRFGEVGRPWVVGGIEWINSEGRSLGFTSAPPLWMSAKIMACLGWCCLWHMSAYVSRQFFAELGGFDISFKDAGDFDFFSRALSVSKFAPIRQPLAAYRRTGENNSAIHKSRMEMEARRVRDTFGPNSPVERQAYKWLLKLWLNARNPQWCLLKHLAPVPPKARF